MKLLITGAAGFLGGHVVRAAVAAGHEVVALSRREHAPQPEAGVAWRVVDLCRADGLGEALAGCDAVLHLAGSMSGDEQAMHANTVDATNHLINEMARAGVPKLVLVGSLSVYDYASLAPGAVLDEQSPIESKPELRDAYCRVKLAQERLAQDRAAEHRIALTIARPGAIYGPGRLWTARMGVGGAAGFYFLVGGDTLLPLTYAGNCAQALVRAAERDGREPRVYNIIDDGPVTQRGLVRALRDAGGSVPRTLALPYGLSRCAAGLATSLNGVVGGKLPVPGVLRRRAFEARFKPLRYSNDRAKSELGWTPTVALADAIRVSLDPPTPDASQPA